MSTYVIGDVQGCYDALQELLTHIQFNSKQDSLWFTGDLVNRGPRSLDVLRFIKNLGSQHKTVLGNHDLHLLAVFYKTKPLSKNDTLIDILNAPDVDELIDWLRCQPLLYAHDDVVLVHAGLAPAWDLPLAQQLAKEVEEVLQNSHPENFLQHLYGNEPHLWRNDLKGVERLRCIVNYFTRMRFCYEDGGLELNYKGTIADKPNTLHPWFAIPNRVNAKVTIIFGHWAALNGKTGYDNLYALDTGCVWGNCLTAMRLEDRKHFSVNCSKERNYGATK